MHKAVFDGHNQSVLVVGENGSGKACAIQSVLKGIKAQGGAFVEVHLDGGELADDWEALQDITEQLSSSQIMSQVRVYLSIPSHGLTSSLYCILSLQVRTPSTFSEHMKVCCAPCFPPHHHPRHPHRHCHLPVFSPPPAPPSPPPGASQQRYCSGEKSIALRKIHGGFSVL